MRSYTLPSFTGLDLRTDPEEAPGAIDALNVDFDGDGRVRTRYGYSELVATGANLWTAFRNYGTSGAFVAAGLGGSAFKVFTSAGATTATGNNGVNGLALSLAGIATPTTNYIYAGDGDANGHITRWDGSSITYPNVGYNALHATSTPWDNRLVLANITYPDSNPSGVRFSNPADPDDAVAQETFGVNNHIQLSPGDREQISAVCVWRNQLFVFKNTKFYVVYGTSTDATGEPIFNYRTVDSGVGVGAPGTTGIGGAVAMNDGVYFNNHTGLYRTTGGPPIKISAPVDPVFGVGSAAYFTGGTYDMGGVSNVGRWRDKVLVGYAIGGGAYATLAYDTVAGTWTYWNLGSTAFLEYQADSTSERQMLIATNGGFAISLFGPSYTDDDGANIASKYRTGFIDAGTPDAEKLFRELILDGTGTVTVKSAVNDAVSLGSGATVALGTSPAVAQGRDGRARWGRNMSVEVSATSGQWSLSRLTVPVLGERDSGAKSP